jgi:ribosomal protein S18 acetylase RimI-like enzyme
MVKKSKIDLRKMGIDDISQVFHIGEKLFTAERFPTLYRTWDEYEVTHFFNIEPDLCLVACRGDKVIGFVLGNTIEKPQTAWNYGYLVWLGVLKRYQKRGVAKMLLDEIANELKQKGIRILIVDTQADNKDAVRFFKKYGFSNPSKHIYMSLNMETTQR